MRFWITVAGFVGWTGLFLCSDLRAEPVEFGRDIRPLLADRCFACHGPDEDARETDLRLDTREGAIADLGDYQAITPGNPRTSEMIRRIMSNDPDEMMPPPSSNKSLSDEDRQKLIQWVRDGAEYKQHWSFIAPERSPLPRVKQQDWPRNAIDYFVLAALEARGYQPSNESDRYSLIRRVYLDLIGLPPTVAEADAFVHDSDPHAYEKVVDRLLASPHYGERWGRRWLDLARYSDTNGYEKDRPRSIWPYRDWVIAAINRDLGFDRFSIEQLAGDMIPDATEDQLVATGFHRNTMLNEEGGIDPLEYRFHAMVDRVKTTGAVWMGLTMGCAQCHTHKYDPITHTEYYQFFALLNNADEPDLIVRDPNVEAGRRQMQQQVDERILAEVKRLGLDASAIASEPTKVQESFVQWIRSQSAVDWRVIRPAEMSTNLPLLTLMDDGSIFSTGDITKRDVFELEFQVVATQLPLTALRLEVMADDRLPARGPGRAFYEGRKGDFFLSEVDATLDGKPLSFSDASHNFGKLSIGNGSADAKNVLDDDGSTGWSTATREGETHQLVLHLAEPIQTSGRMLIQLLFERHFAASLGRFRFWATTHQQPVKAKQVPIEIERLFLTPMKDWQPTAWESVAKWFVMNDPQFEKIRKPIRQLQRSMPGHPTTMVLRERPESNPRATHRHHRGEYLQAREAVSPGLPAVFGMESMPGDRLGLASWLVSAQNPLVARVTANRAWRTLMGRGLVVTSGDFGLQAPEPSHPQLLDWLACELMESGWSMKQLHRLIVTSATYRQSAATTTKQRQRDPQNIWLSRASRFRVDAELIRDIGLSTSGLLTSQLGGPSVFPPQEASVTQLAYGGTKWNVSKGGDRYRRSVYTYSKRTAPFAVYTVFDGPTGENCIPRRDRSNTPLQALTMLNDPMFLEMTEALARRIDQHAGDFETRLGILFRQCATRYPNRFERDKLTAFYRKQIERLTAGELDAKKIMNDPQAADSLAAWFLTARVVLNLDEVIVRP